MTNPAIVKELMRQADRLPTSDYRNQSESAEQPLMLKGGIRIIEEFAKLSFKYIHDIDEKHPVLSVNKDVQLYLLNDKPTYYGIESAATAVFPIFEPNFIGHGTIYLGRYRSKIDEKSDVEQMRVRKGELFYLNRSNPDNGYYILVRDSEHTEERYACLYRIGNEYSKLLAFGSDKKGWFKPKLRDESLSAISFDKEKPSFYGGIVFDVYEPTRLIEDDYRRLQRVVEDYKIKFIDSYNDMGILIPETV